MKHLGKALAGVGVLVFLASGAALAAPGDPGEPIRLNGDLPAKVDFAKCHGHDITLTDDGDWVIYNARQDDRDKAELYAVRIDGTDGHKVNTETPEGRGAGLVGLTGDGSRIVWQTRTGPFSDLSNIYTTPIAGGPSTLLAGPFELRDAWLTPDAQTLVFFAEGAHFSIADLYTVPVTGGTPTLVLSITDFDFSAGTAVTPDGTRAVYGREVLGDTREVDLLYTVSLAGGPPVALAPPIGSDGSIQGRTWRISPDSSQVVLIAKRVLDDSVEELFSAPLDGSPGARLSRLFPTGGDVKDFQISADSSRVVYRADQETNDQRELFSVPIEGGVRTRLNDPMPAKGDVSYYSISPDSSRVVYRADQETNNVHEIFSVPLGGGDPVRLNRDLPAGGDVKRGFYVPSGCRTPAVWPEGHGITPDSATVVYIADQAVNNKRQAYAVPIEGGEPDRLNPSIGPKRDIEGFAISPDSALVAYVGDQDSDNVRELYVVGSGGGPSTRLSGPFPAGGDMKAAFTFDATSERVVYIADQLVDNRRELFAVQTP